MGGRAGIQDPKTVPQGTDWIGPDYEYAQSDVFPGAHVHFVARPGAETLFQVRGTLLRRLAKVRSPSIGSWRTAILFRRFAHCVPCWELLVCTGLLHLAQLATIYSFTIASAETDPDRSQEPVIFGKWIWEQISSPLGAIGSRIV
jgi:hypothetical protein